MANSYFVSPTGRGTWLHHVSPDKSFDPNNSRLEVTIIFSNRDDINALLDIVEQTGKSKFGKQKFEELNREGKFQTPIKSNSHGFEQGWQGYEDPHGVNVKFSTDLSKVRNRPVCLDRNKQIIEPSIIQAGFHIRVRFAAFAWEKGGKAGVSFFYNKLQLVKEDEVLGGSGEDFDDLPPEDDEAVSVDLEDDRTPF